MGACIDTKVRVVPAIVTAGIKVGDAGASSIAGALKRNTTLKEFPLASASARTREAAAKAGVLVRLTMCRQLDRKRGNCGAVGGARGHLSLH